jgi:hypothetical protein
MRTARRWRYRWALFGVCVFALVATVVTSTPASANRIVRKDGNDTRGPLDLARVVIDHASKGSEFQLTTVKGFRLSQVNGDSGFFEIAFDRNADGTFDFRAYVFYTSPWRGVLVNKAGDVINAGLPVRLLSKRTVRVQVPHRLIGDPESYDMAAFSVYRETPCTHKDPCVDSIPNRFPLIRHDLTAPVIRARDIPEVSTEISADVPFPLSFTVEDDRYGSGVKRWTLQSKLKGTSTWKNVASGHRLSPTVMVTGDEGATYLYQVLVVDKQGNAARRSFGRTTIPFDDANAVFDYSGATWTADPAVSAAFLQTTHAGAKGGVAMLAGVKRGIQVCVIGGPTAAADATATVSIEGVDQDMTLTEHTTTPPRALLACFAPPGSGPLDVSITVTSDEPFVLDGIAILH